MIAFCAEGYAMWSREEPGGIGLLQMISGKNRLRLEVFFCQAEALKLQASLKAQIWLEDGHVSSGLRGFA
jgi:hypothetical protein